MPAKRSKSERREDPYDVLGVSKNCTDQEIKSAYRKLALKYHPDKNANDPKATDMFNEVTFAYKILSDPDKRNLFDADGFKAVESEDSDEELDLSILGAMDTFFTAVFSKLGVQIKTAVPATILEEARHGSVTTVPLELGHSLFKKVKKHSAHFYSVTITEEEALGGIVCRVCSPRRSKFKLLYFEPEKNCRLSLALQEDSTKVGKVTSAGMYFLGFPVHQFDPTIYLKAAADDLDTAFFKKLDGFQRCELNELKAGSHVFAVYDDNFFKCTSYTIEVVCAANFKEENEDLRAVESQILTKKAELSKFESEYREVPTDFTEMTSKYNREMQAIDDLLKRRNEIHALYTAVPKRTTNRSKNKCSSKETKEEKPTHKDKDRSKKRWYDVRSKFDRRKVC